MLTLHTVLVDLDWLFSSLDLNKRLNGLPARFDLAFSQHAKIPKKLKTSVQVGKIQAAEWEHSSHRFCWGEQKTIPFVSVFSHHTPHYTTRMWAAIAERTAARRKTGYDFFIFLFFLGAAICHPRRWLIRQMQLLPTCMALPSEATES